MIGVIPKNEKGEIEASVSQYQPPNDVVELTRRISTDYALASDLQNKPFTEFNDMSLLERADYDQKRWNAYREPQSEDVDEAWRYNGVRPITRNRILAIVAQMTANLIIPAPYAQNDDDEVDYVASEVMRDLMEYNIRNSSYVEDYIEWITDALVNPIAYMSVGFVKAMQSIKDENGKRKDVLDKVLSGFQTFNIPFDEVLFGNFYQRKLEQQRFLIRRRYIDIDEAESKWGDHENWTFVQPGVRTILGDEPSLFYDVKDEDMPTMVEEVTYFNRTEDLEVSFVNGIYMGDKDVEINRIKHRDNEDYPKYNIVGLGYEIISPRFAFYKSAAWKLGDDDELVIRMEQLTADGTFLSVMPPTITAGHGQLSEAIVIPGKNTSFENPDVRVTPIQLGSALQAGWNAILKKEKDMSESTMDPLMAGVQTGSRKTATEANLLVYQAKVSLGRFGRMLAVSLKKLGDLMIDVIVNHQTVGEVSELTGEQKYKTFVLETPDTTKKIVFKPEMMGSRITKEKAMERSFELLEEEGVDSKMRIMEVNPQLWRNLKYYLFIDVEELIPPVIRDYQKQQQELQQGLKVEGLAINK